MLEISRVKRLLAMRWGRVAVLCVLCNLWGFIPPAGAGIMQPVGGPGEVRVGATAAALRTAGDLLAMSIVSGAGALAMAGADAADAGAQPPGIVLAGQGDRPPDPPPPKRPKPRQLPEPRPKPSPVR